MPQPMTAPVTHRLDPDGVGWIVFDDPSARANVFNLATQAALRTAIDALEKLPVRAVVVASAKDKIFIAGADLKWLARLPDAATAEAASRTGHQLFGRLADFKVPVVCAIHGACAGGGCELALACHWRIASDAPATQIGLPEVGIGTIPGWGGCTRLPRLVGTEAAVAHILKAALISATDARHLGLVDEVVAPAQLLERARATALRLAHDGKPSRPAAARASATFFADTRKTISARSRIQAQATGEKPAALAVLDAIEQSENQPVDAALAIEAREFGAVTAGSVCKNLIHGFFLRDANKKQTLAAWFTDPATENTPPFRRIGVVGAGVMGSGIAQACAARGFDVVLTDANADALRRGEEVIAGLFAEAEQRGKLTADGRRAAEARLKRTTALADFSTCDLVIEAIVENVAAKQSLFAQLAPLVRPDCVLASNTSALPIDEITARAADATHTIGIHFFNPVSRMPLVELVLAPKTSRATAERALALVCALGKTPVVCRSSPGFLVTRVLFFYLNAACRLLESGVPAERIDGALRAWGWPMGPLRLIDEVGVDVTEFIFGEMAHYFPARFSRTTICARLLAAGMKGRKNGASTGFYRYDANRETLNPAARELITASATEMPDDEIATQLMRVMVEETQRCLHEGVIKTPDEADFALLQGCGFPAWRGGLMHWATAGSR